MKRAGMLAMILVALAAGFVGSFAKDVLFEPGVVDAQAGTTPPLRIALLDLEEAARSSMKFKELKSEWELRQNELKKTNAAMQAEVEEKKAALRRAQSTNDTEEMASLRVDLAALEENIKATREVQKRFLSDLLEHYQKGVIEHVLAVADEYCVKEGYHLVMQNYETTSQEGELFAGANYSERILNKPVLFTPGTKSKKNPYVVDITAQIVAKVQVAGNAPPKKPE